MIFTFYSYKGGVGRSLALAHVAHALAERGLRVLAVDFDLEAPGLERYCFAGSDSVKTAREHRGLIDLIMAYRRTLTSTAAFEARAFRDWKQYVLTVRNPVNAQGGRLELMTAGRRASPEQLRDYSLTVRTFDWLDFFHNWNGDAFFKWLRDEWTRADIGYDVVLVDSRTGVTEMGGVCAYQLADVAVLLCAPNEQNLDGTLDVMRDFGSPGVLGLRGGRPLKLLAVPTRLEQKHPLRDSFLKHFAELLGPPALGPDVPVTYADLALPYLPAFAIAEPVVGGPPGSAGDDERAAYAMLTASMRRLADALTLLAAPASRLGQQGAQALASLRGDERPQGVALEADTSRRSAGYDFFIDCGADDVKAGTELAQLLRSRNLEVFIDTGSISMGEDWAAEIERALDYSACLLVCFGKASASRGRTSLLKRARGSSRRVLIVPVLLPRGSEGALHSFGLEGQQRVDLRRGMDAASIEPLIAARRRASNERPARGTVEHANPYRGALPYGEDDARLLFGREEEIRQLVEALASSSVVWVDGAAKVGKTSLVLAGVLPAWRARAGASAAQVLIQVHDAALGQAWPQWSAPAAASGRPKNRQSSQQRKVNAAPAEELIVIDHCDDFGAAPVDEARLQRNAALHQLIPGTGAQRRLLIVARSPDLADANNSALALTQGRQMRQFTVQRLDGMAWRQAITEPAQMAGHLLENGLAERLTEGAGTARSALLQAQLALAALWDMRSEGWLTNRALDALGHLAGVFKRHLDASLAALDAADRRAATVLCQALCQLEARDGVPLAAPLPWSQARTPAALAAVGAERLRDRLAAFGLIDLWHDASPPPGADGLQVALARSDARSFFGDETWAAERDFMAWRGRMAPALLQWRHGGRQPGALLPEGALAEAARWMGLRRDALTAAELDFVESSLDALRLRSPSQQTRGVALPASAAADAGRASGGAHEPLRVSVLNGDLRFVAGPLMLGHYRCSRLTGTEAIADRQLGGSLSRALDSGVYPDQPGLHHLFDNAVADRGNPLAMARPAAVLVVGLGEEGRLRSADLVHSVRQAVLALLARQPPSGPGPVALSTTLMGTGAVGVGTSSCAQLVAQGVQEASQLSRAGGGATVDALQFVELFHDRASEAWRALRQECLQRPQAMTLGFGVETGSGALRRAMLSSYRGVAYDVISTSMPSVEGQAIEFVVTTSRARSEIRAHTAQTGLLRKLVAKASNDATVAADLRRTLFKLLVPAELGSVLGGTDPLVLEVDSLTAGMPWEMLDTSAAGSAVDGLPWAIRTQLIRRLHTVEFRVHPTGTATDDNVLVIGEPMGPPPFAVALPGARREARAVAKVLAATGAGRSVVRLVEQQDAQSVLGSLLERPWRILHIAGQGDPSHHGGVVLSEPGALLGAKEIAALRTLPELVFINCGHLASIAPATESANRAEFAADIGLQLIRAGVRCVVMGGWALADAPAELFATTFYSRLLVGMRFAEAVAAARKAAWEAHPESSTWAAYQCYGDPDWVFRAATFDAALAGPDGGDGGGGFDEIASPVDLALALETLAVRAGSSAAAGASAHQVRMLEDRYAQAWGGIGAVAEAFGLACAEARATDRAIAWYRRALGAHDGSASFNVAERLGKLLVRRAAGQADAMRGRADLEAAITHLDRLVALQPTPGREMLLASAWKQLAIILVAGGQVTDTLAAERRKALHAMARHYGNAERIAGEAGLPCLPDAGTNALGAELALALLEGRALHMDPARIAAVESALSSRLADTPDFHSAVAPIAFRVLLACAKHRLSTEAAVLTRQYRDLHARIPSRELWRPVCAEAALTLDAYARSAGAAESRAAGGVLMTLRELAGT